MPRAEPLNEKIIQALESRKRRSEILGQQKQFQYVRAIQLITEFRGKITRLSQITSLCRPNKITKAIFNEIEDVLSGKCDVEVPEPSPAQQARAQARGPIQQRLPGVETGAGAILLVLYRESLKPNGSSTMTKDQIMRRATDELHVNMFDESAGFSRWSGIKSLEHKLWVKREAFSRRFGGGGSGRFGGAKDQFWITEEGKAAAARLETQLRGQPGASATSPAAAAAAGLTPCRAAGGSSRFAGAGYAGGRDDDYDGDDPFAALLGSFLQGPQFTRSPAAAAAAAGGGAGRYQQDHSAGTNTSPFSGRGRVLGQNSSHHPAAAAAAAAAADGAGTSRRGTFDPGDYLDDDEVGLDADGFQIYRQEWFEDQSPLPAARKRQQQQQMPAAVARSQYAAAAAAAAAVQTDRPVTATPNAAVAAAAATVGTGSRENPLSRGLIPKTRKADKREPLCDSDSRCSSCKSLRKFIDDLTSTTLLMSLTSKAKLQHVQQRVAYLVSLEGGQWPLTVTTDNDGSLTIRKQPQTGSRAQRRPASTTNLDPLAELSRMLGTGKQQLQQQQQHQDHQRQQQQATQQTPSHKGAAQPHTATNTAAMQQEPSMSSFKQQQGGVTPAQMAAAAAEARVKQQQNHQPQQQQQQREQVQKPQQQQTAAVQEPIILDSQVDDVAVVFNSAPQLIDLALLESQDVWDVGCAAAAAATGESPPRKKRRQQDLNSSRDAGGLQDLDDEPDIVALQNAAAAAAEAGGVQATPGTSRKRQRREQVQQQQQQKHQAAGECISLLESQDVDFQIPNPDLGHGPSQVS